MISEETYELIEKYLQGDLSETDRRSFEHRLEKDPEFSEQVKIHQAAFDLVIDTGVLQVKEKLGKIHRMETGKEKLWKWKIYLSGLLLTACLGIGTYYYFSGQEKKSEMVNSSSSQSSLTTSPVLPSPENKTESNTAHSTVAVNKNERNTGNDQRDQSTSVVSKPAQDTLRPVREKELSHSLEESRNRQEPNMVKPVVKETDCAAVKITGAADSKASCLHEATGAIFIDLGSVSGGTKPYRYSVSDDEEYSVAAQYDRLSPGLYTVKVKDLNGCSGILATVKVESMDCPREYAFAPSRGEEWTVPVEVGLSGELKIMDKKGTMVYTFSFHNGQISAWTGVDHQGQALPSGVYMFVILYANGNTQRGHVTILQ